MTSKRVARVCQHQLFSLLQSEMIKRISGIKCSTSS